MSTREFIRQELLTWAENAEMWEAEQAKHLRNTARQCYMVHDCGGNRSVEVRENCGACCLGGYYPYTKRHRVREEGPNYAGWLRTYIQLGIVPPASWQKAVWSELKRVDNPAYLDALRRDIVTFLQ